MKLALLLSLIMSMTFAACGKQEALEEAADDTPGGIMTMALSERNLAKIVSAHSSAIVRPTPWASWWWPYGSNGIAGPGEKYDTIYKRYLESRGVDTSNYQGVADWERMRHSPRAPMFEGWFGHCNGWSAAALNYPEPREPKVIDGVEFSVGDQKALISESWMEFTGDFVGRRVNDKGDFSSDRYWDVAPAQFTLILANIVSGGNRGIIFDRHTGDQIWNQPLVAYRFHPIKPDDYLGAHPAAPDVYRVNMRATITWSEDRVGRDDITPEFNPEKPSSKFFTSRTLDYELWLDGPVTFDASGRVVSSGNIMATREDDRYVGGFWKNSFSGEGMNNAHPDYMWTPFAIQGSSGYKNERIDDRFVKEKIAGL